MNSKRSLIQILFALKMSRREKHGLIKFKKKIKELVLCTATAWIKQKLMSKDFWISLLLNSKNQDKPREIQINIANHGHSIMLFRKVWLLEQHWS